MVQTFAGPVGSLINDSAALTLGNLYQYIQGKETAFGKELVNYMQRYTPGNNAWYMRLAMERLMWDSLFDFTLGTQPISRKGTSDSGGAKRRSALSICLY